VFAILVEMLKSLLLGGVLSCAHWGIVQSTYKTKEWTGGERQQDGEATRKRGGGNSKNVFVGCLTKINPTTQKCCLVQLMQTNLDMGGADEEEDNFLRERSGRKGREKVANRVKKNVKENFQNNINYHVSN